MDLSCPETAVQISNNPAFLPWVWPSLALDDLLDIAKTQMDEPLKFLAAFVGQIWSPVGYSGCHYSYILSAQDTDQSDLGQTAHLGA